MFWWSVTLNAISAVVCFAHTLAAVHIPRDPDIQRVMDHDSEKLVLHEHIEALAVMGVSVTLSCGLCIVHDCVRENATAFCVFLALMLAWERHNVHVWNRAEAAAAASSPGAHPRWVLPSRALCMIWVTGLGFFAAAFVLSLLELDTSVSYEPIAPVLVGLMGVGTLSWQLYAQSTGKDGRTIRPLLLFVHFMVLFMLLHITQSRSAKGMAITWLLPAAICMALACIFLSTVDTVALETDFWSRPRIAMAFLLGALNLAAVYLLLREPDYLSVVGFIGTAIVVVCYRLTFAACQRFTGGQLPSPPDVDNTGVVFPASSGLMNPIPNRPGIYTIDDEQRSSVELASSVSGIMDH